MTPSHHPVGLIPEGIKLSEAESFEGENDSESVNKFVAILEIYFYLVRLKNDNTRALFAKNLLTKLARTWYDA